MVHERLLVEVVASAVAVNIRFQEDVQAEVIDGAVGMSSLSGPAVDIGMAGRIQGVVTYETADIGVGDRAALIGIQDLFPGAQEGVEEIHNPAGVHDHPRVFGVGQVGGEGVEEEIRSLLADGVGDRMARDSALEVSGHEAGGPEAKDVVRFHSGHGKPPCLYPNLPLITV